MDQIVVRIEDKFINEAFQKWCFSVGFKWNNGETNFIDYGAVLLVFSEDKTITFGPITGTPFSLPEEWNEATIAILEMIKPKERKWTDEDMIRFAKKCNPSFRIDQLYEDTLKYFK